MRAQMQVPLTIVPRGTCSHQCKRSRTPISSSTLQIFATLVLLAKKRGQQDLRWVVLRIVLEFLQIFRVVFNTEFL
jgi:hypothetical protein